MAPRPGWPIRLEEGTVAVAGTASPRPDLAPKLHLLAPSHLLHVLEDFDEGVELDAPATALRALRQAFELLLGFSADLLGAACVALGAEAELYVLTEGDLFRPQDAEVRIKEALYFLSQQPESPLTRELISIFFDGAGNPKQYYLLTQGGRVEGKLGGLDRISDFCKEPVRPPGRSESFKLRNAYLPHLEAWLHALSQVWEQSQRLWERTDLKGNQRLCYRFHEWDLEVGQRLQLHDCKACIPSRVVQAPSDWVRGEPFVGIPQEVPEHTLHLIDRFIEALEKSNIIESTRLLRDNLEFLLRYFAGVGKMLCQELDCFTEDARKFARDTEQVDNCERLLQAAVESLKSHQDDVAAKEFVSVFYRRDANFKLQPRSHTNILLLEGVLSSWFKQERGQQPDAARYAKDFERYFPLFRDWVGAMGPYFSHTEHFSDPPSEHGQLPLTARCGEHLLELVDDAYCLRIRQCPVCLPNPIWVREATQQAKAKVKVAAAPSAVQLLQKANEKPAEASVAAEAVARSEASTAAEAVVAKAGEVRAFPGEFRPIDLPPDAPKFLGRILRRLDVRVRRGELPESRDALRDSIDYLLRYWAGVCWACANNAGKLSEEEEEMASRSLSIQECEKLLSSTLKKLEVGLNELSEEIIQVYYKRDPFSEELAPMGSHTRMLLTDASSDNQMQLLADFCEYEGSCDVNRARRDLKTFLPILRDWLEKSQGFFEQCQHHEEEPDGDGRMELVVQWDNDYLELVAPDYSFYVRKGCDQVPDLEVPEWVEPAEPRKEDEVAKPKIITSEELALSEPFLIHKVQYIGITPNSKGTPCKSGIISIQNAGGGSLTGRAFSNHPCIEVNPNRFREKTQLTYWLDESQIPRDFVPVLTLRSGGDERQVTLAELRPLSAFNTMPKSQALMFVYAPPVLGFLVINGLAMYRAGQMRDEIGTIQGKLKDFAPDTLNKCLALGSQVGGSFLLYSASSAVITLAIYRRFSHSLQDLLGKHFHRAAFLALPLALTTAALQALAFTTLRHPEITNANLLKLTPWAIFFSIGSVIYVNLDYEGKFNEWIQDLNLRRLVSPVALAIFIVLWTLALT